ncbi:uncharacterized protein K460DRAFT_394059 [Cucurbitaria berberidis CBS 394.84]|uniref:Uncharacterized protein n=1 Tax=Cucurbitaria berberidis CBS 394.84 TaxID=1168544 RepID=A0A9P4GP57_9PLEO|nr:uncharacterized protein K460DRAFT_394059 [Cucurbitaria berberidis CBS 394.84]KAF1849165.1 hypothetical protein K460DRAFT_394059 [Cucurbitaria berberidis CBS 394.84]
MSSYPQYKPQPPAPYPTTPGPTQAQPQQPPFYPPTPQQHQQQQHALYSSTPPTFSQPFYSSSPSSLPNAAMGINPIIPQQKARRSSSTSSTSYPSQPWPGKMQPIPIPMRQPNPSDYYYQQQRTPPSSWPPQQQQQGYGYAPQPQTAPFPIYAQRPASMQSTHSGSYHSQQHMHDTPVYANGEEKYESKYGPIDEDTEREYERRYAKEKRAQRALENRPTLGGSLLSMVGKVGRAIGGSDKR